MQMEDKYKLLFLRFLYIFLDLKQNEKNLIDKGIEALNNDNSEYSDLKYFSILNDGEIDVLTEEEKEILNKMEIVKVEDFIERADLYQYYHDFLLSTYKRFFFSKVEEVEPIYYGAPSYETYAPNDAIALGINYRKFADSIESNNNYDESLMLQDNIVGQEIDNIQNKAEKLLLKCAVIKKDEIVLSQNNYSIGLM